MSNYLQTFDQLQDLIFEASLNEHDASVTALCMLCGYLCLFRLTSGAVGEGGPEIQMTPSEECIN